MAENPVKRQTGKLPKKSHNLYLGVDGGGTKTHIVLINDKHEFVSEGFAGASNPLRVGIQSAVSNILQAVNAACDSIDRSPADIAAATLGLAGVRRADLRERIRELIFRQLEIPNIEVVTDAEIALYGAASGKAGLVVIAGTGSICIGQDNQGNKFSAGGWGPLAGDEGGGAGIARSALHAIAKASDGRAPQTKLSEAAIDYFRAAHLDDLVVAIYAPQIDNQKIAGFARYVGEIAQTGDEVAVKLLAEAAGELALAATAVIKKLKLENEKFPIARVGSVFKSGDLIAKPFMEQINRVAPKAYLAEPKLSPSVAAAEMAFNLYTAKSKAA